MSHYEKESTKVGISEAEPRFARQTQENYHLETVMLFTILVRKAKAYSSELSK